MIEKIGPNQLEQLKCFLIAQTELVTLGTSGNTISHRYAMGREWGSRPTSNPNPRTNKQTNWNKCLGFRNIQEQVRK